MDQRQGVEWLSGEQGRGVHFPSPDIKENVAQKPGIIVFSPYKWPVQNSTCFQKGVFVLHQITLCYEYVLITFTPLHFYKCKGLYFVISREVPFLRLASFCHMVIFFTPSLFHNFSLEIMLTAVQFLLACIYNVLGRALIILYILTIILVGLAMELMGRVGFTDSMYLYEIGDFFYGYCIMSAILLYKRICSEIVLNHKPNYLYKDAWCNPCDCSRFVQFTSGDKKSDIHNNYLFLMAHSVGTLCRITRSPWRDAVHIDNNAGQVHFCSI